MRETRRWSTGDLHLGEHGAEDMASREKRGAGTGYYRWTRTLPDCALGWPARTAVGVVTLPGHDETEHAACRDVGGTADAGRDGATQPGSESMPSGLMSRTAVHGIDGWPEEMRLTVYIGFGHGVRSMGKSQSGRWPKTKSSLPV